MLSSEVESLRTSLASRTSTRTHFEVLGLGLKASSPRKLPCPWVEDCAIFEPLKFCWKTPETLRKICKDLFFLENTCVCVLGSGPWPREGLSLALSLKFFCVLGLGLEPCVHLWLALFDASILLLIAVELVSLLCINLISVKLSVKLFECYYGPYVRCINNC